MSLLDRETAFAVVGVTSILIAMAFGLAGGMLQMLGSPHSVAMASTGGVFMGIGTAIGFVFSVFDGS